MAWWIWIIAGFSLLGLELFLPTGFFLFVIGLSGLIVGGLLGAGLSLPVWGQWTTCAVLTFLLLPLLRKALPGSAIGIAGTRVTDVEGEEVRILRSIDPGAVGQGELRGSLWKVRNVGTHHLEADSLRRVSRVDGLTLEVK